MNITLAVDGEKATFESHQATKMKAVSAANAARYHHNHVEKRVLISTLLVSDGIMVSLALVLAWYIRIGSGWFSYNNSLDFSEYAQLIPFAVIIFIALFQVNHLYLYNLLLGGSQEYASVFRSCSYGLIVLVFVSFLQRTHPLSRGWLLLSWVFSVTFVGLARFILRRVFHWLRRKYGWLTTRVLIVGANSQARAIAHQLITQYTGADIVGFIDDYLPFGTPVIEDRLVLGTPTQLHDIARQHGIEQVIVLPDAVAWETFQDVMQQAVYRNGLEIQMSPSFYEILTTSVEVTHKGFVPLLHVDFARIKGLDLILKTVLDFGLGTLLLVPAIPLMAVIALALRLHDGAPIFDYSTILGLQGIPFRTTHFRTQLTIASRIHSGPCRLGSFLYRSGLDKLPQLFDVLRGRMSLVGPRATNAQQSSKTKLRSPSLLTVKPGWTGPWAINKTKTPREEQLLDLYYVRNWTIWLDLQVLFQAARLSLGAKSREEK